MTTQLSAQIFGFQRGTIRSQWVKNLALAAAMVVMTIALFIVDVRLEQGSLDGYPYLAPLIIASFIRARNVAFPAAVILSVVAIFGFTHSDTAHQILDNEMVGMMNVAIAIVSLFGMAFAIEHHRNLRVELAERLDQLRAGEALRHRILSVIAHDLRSPLMPIIGFGELLAGQNRQLTDTQVVEYGDDIAKSGHELLDTLDKLLDWARSVGTGTEERAIVHIRAQADSAIALLEPVAAEKGIQLVSRIGPCTVFAEPTAVGTIIRNLIANAIKFSPGGKAIVISADNREGQVVLEVSDEGVGMPPALVRSLNTAGPVRSRAGTAGETGTGLGLDICRSLAERSGGTLTVRSREGEGTTVTVALPRAEAP